MKKTPVALQKELFGGKDKLVAAVKKLATKDLWLDRVSDAKGLEGISNAKLLRLHAALEDTKKRFGSRDKLIAAIAELEKRAKDEGFKAGLAHYPLPRLLDLHGAAEKRAKKAPSAAPKAKKKPARSKKAQAKAALGAPKVKATPKAAAAKAKK
jgi:hypothetical protein